MWPRRIPAMQMASVISLERTASRWAAVVSVALAVVCLLLSAAARSQIPATFADRLVDAAMERLSHRETYDGSYRRIAYPNGDVPDSIGVCTDLVIRAYRGVGLDLQQLVHEDMRDNFDLYPTIWGLRAPDTNIDHRRVPNLQKFFS